MIKLKNEDMLSRAFDHISAYVVLNEKLAHMVNVTDEEMYERCHNVNDAIDWLAWYYEEQQAA